MPTKIELRKLADELIDESSFLNTSRKCVIENEIPFEIYLYTREKDLVFILNRFLSLIIQSSYNSRIRVSAIREESYTSIFIEDNNNDYSEYISGKMEKHKSRIQESGCYLSFEFNDKRSITVILRFTDRKYEELNSN